MITSSTDLLSFARHTKHFLKQAYKSNDYTSISTDDYISLLFLADKLPKSIGVRHPYIDVPELLLECKREKSLIQTVAVVNVINHVCDLAILSIEHFGETRATRYIKEAHQELTFNGYAIEAYANRMSHDHIENMPDYSIIALMGELGEAANIYKKIRRGDYTFAEKKEALFDELGDVLWYLNEVCSQMGTSLDEIAHVNMRKMENYFKTQLERAQDQMEDE